MAEDPDQSKETKTDGAQKQEQSNVVVPFGGFPQQGLGYNGGGFGGLDFGLFRFGPLGVFPPIPGVPKGLEPLWNIDSIHVLQQLEMLELVFGLETENRYDVVNKYGQRIYFAGEKSEFCDRQCLGGNRPFVLYLFDSQGRVAVTMERDCNSKLRCWGARYAGTIIDIKSGFTGELYGTIAQNCDYCTPHFSVLNSNGDEVMVIVGPSTGSCINCIMCCDAEFQVYLSELDPNQKKSGERPKAGSIMKRFGLQEMISDANMFGISFNSILDPKLKAVLLGATFAIDFAFFETSGGGGRRGIYGGGMYGNGGGGGGCACSICCGTVFLLSFIIPLVGFFVFAIVAQKIHGNNN